MRVIQYRLQIGAIALMALMSITGLTRAHAFPGTEISMSEENTGTELALEKALWPVLRPAGKVARIYYRGVCTSSGDDLVAFPHIQVQRPSARKAALTAVRDMFKNSGDVAINEDRSGIIRIRIGIVPNTILRTRISSVAFDPTSQYNPTLAIATIIATPEVQSAAVSSNIRIPPMLFHMLTVQPAAGLPHLPPTITNATVDQMLDLTASTFGGIVLYGACSQPDLLNIRFAGNALQ